MSLPVLLVSGIGGIWSAALNAERRFTVAAISPVATPAITAALLWLVPMWRGRSLVTGLIGGEVVELILLGVALKRAGFSLLPAAPRLDTEIRRLASQYFPVFVGSIFMSTSVVVDQAMAAMFPSGSVATLNYANGVVQFPILLIATALGTATLPYFSGLATEGNWEGLRRLINSIMLKALWLTLPVTIILTVFSTSLISLLLKRGAFTNADVHQVARVSACFALQVPFYIWAVLLARVASALQATRILMWGALGGVFLNVVLNYLLMTPMGVAGIALSTSLVYAFIMSFSYVSIMRLLSDARRVAHAPAAAPVTTNAS